MPAVPAFFRALPLVLHCRSVNAGTASFWPAKQLFARAALPRARSFRRHDVLGLPIHRDIARLRRHAIEPGADLRKSREVVIARMREMGVGIERDVGDAV